MTSVGDAPRSGTQSHTLRDISYYRDLERTLLVQLQAEIQSGNAKPAEQIGNVGAILNALCDELMQHPLCHGLARPRLYLHKSLDSRMGTFADVIIVPSTDAGKLLVEDPSSKALVRACLAHELGHLIAGDATPEMRAMQETNDHQAEIEKRADLIAAHLCGDGGAALARWAGQQQEEASMLAHVFGQTWRERVKKAATESSTRYPEWDERLQYLRQWADDFKHGQSLPIPVLGPIAGTRDLHGSTKSVTPSRR